MMTRAERLVFHQIHPAKLLTDVATSFASCWLLWQHEWALAAVVALAPSVMVSVMLLWRADLEPLRHTPLGRYVAAYMTRRVEAIRLGGQAIMWIGAGIHMPWLMPLGFVIIVYGWLGRLWIPTPPVIQSRSDVPGQALPTSTATGGGFG